MKKYKGQNNVIKYYLSIFLFYLVVMSLYVGVYFLTHNALYSILLLVIYIPTARAFSLMLTKKCIYSPLAEEADAEKFREMVYEGKLFARHGVTVIMAEYFSGNFQKVVDICTERLNDPKCKRHRYLYMNYFASVCAVTHDRDGLERVCQMFENDVEARSNGDAIRAKFPAFEYHRKSLLGEKKWCREYLKSCTEREGLNRLNEATAAYNYGFELYSLGLTEEAKPYLQKAAGLAPRCFYGVRAAEALDRIDKGLEYEEKREILTPGSCVGIPMKKKIPTVFTVAVIAVTIIGILLIMM